MGGLAKIAKGERRHVLICFDGHAGARQRRAWAWHPQDID